MVAALALLSSLLWGGSDFLGGTMSRRRPPLAVVGVSQGFGLLFMAMVVLATGAWRQPLDYLPWVVLASATGIAGLWAFYSALATGTMGVVSPIAASGVVIPLLVGLYVGESPSALQGLGMALAVVGLILATGPQLSRDQASSGSGARPILLAFVAAVMFGCSLAAIAQGSLTSPVMTMAGMRVFGVTVLTIVALCLRSVGGMRKADLPMAAVIGILDVGANLTYGIAAASGQLAIAGVLGSLYPVVTVMLAYQIHQERLERIQYVGVSMALLGVVLLSS